MKTSSVVLKTNFINSTDTVNYLSIGSSECTIFLQFVHIILKSFVGLKEVVNSPNYHFVTVFWCPKKFI